MPCDISNGSRKGNPKWLDRMRLLGAYAATGRWHDALSELRTHQPRRQAAPELLYFESVARTRRGAGPDAAAHCRLALDSTRGTQHPERAYWAARACLVPPTLAAADAAEVRDRIRLAYETVPGNLGRTELAAALLLRTGGAQAALDMLRPGISAPAAGRLSVLLAALAAVRAGRMEDAREWLKRADAIPTVTINHMHSWFGAEADALQHELVTLLARATRTPRSTPQCRACGHEGQMRKLTVPGSIDTSADRSEPSFTHPGRSLSSTCMRRSRQERLIVRALSVGRRGADNGFVR